MTPLADRLVLAKQWGGKLKQNAVEMESAYDEVHVVAPSVFVEIGSLFGKSLYGYAGACQPCALLIAVDLCNRTNGNALTKTVERLNGEGFEAHWVKGRSQDADVVESVERLLDGRKIDALHIDGSHYHHAVMADYKTYSPMVRPGGLMMFHDIALAKGAKKAWGELRANGESRDLIADPARPSPGIGLLWKRGEQ